LLVKQRLRAEKTENTACESSPRSPLMYDNAACNSHAEGEMGGYCNQEIKNHFLCRRGC